MMLAALMQGLSARTIAEIPNVHVADSTRFVSDPDGVLTDATVKELDARLGAVWRASTAEPAIVIVDRIPEDTDIDTFATELFSAWGIGKKDKDNGVLLLVSRGDRKAAIRTGYGTEGALPDIVCGRILRNEMFPRFREGDYDGGVLAGVEAINRVLTDPAYADELRSEQKSNAARFADDDDFAWRAYIKLCIFAGVAMLLIVVFMGAASRKEDSVTRYHKFNKLTLISAVATFVTLGMAVPALIVAWLMRKRVRSHRLCPNCHTSMNKIDEVNDNAYLTPAQDAEERLDSVDYDVWVCPNCRETDILPYVNKAKSYTVCPTCGARAMSQIANRVITQPTQRAMGLGERIYYCHNCHNRNSIRYQIPKLVVPPVIIAPGSGGRGGGFGGGFGGGSFGGGMTGGGGASGGW